MNITRAGSLTVKTTFKGEGEFAYYATARKTFVYVYVLDYSTAALFTF